MGNLVPSVGVIILQDSKVILVAKKNHPNGSHQLPGGKIEPYETGEQAACRELFATTGLRSESKYMIKAPQEWRATIQKTYGTKIFLMICFICTDFEGEIRETSDAMPVWFELNDLKDL